MNGLTPVILRVSPQTSTGGLRRIRTIAHRALKMDSGAMVRMRPLRSSTGPALDLFFSTPLGCTVAQRLLGASLGEELSGGELTAVSEPAVVMVSQLRDGLESILDGVDELVGAYGKDNQTELGPRSDLMWRGALPPVSGYSLIDWVPGPLLREAYVGMEEEQETSGGPAGMARSLLEQNLVEVTVDDENHRPVSLTGRMVAAMGATGLFNEPSEELKQRAKKLAAARHGSNSDVDAVRISETGSWIRVDGLFGSMYAPKPGSLARVP